MDLLKGKTAIVTGGTRGIGKRIVEKFAMNGANVAFTYASSEAAAQEIEKEFSVKYDVIVKGYKSDASVFAQAEELVANVLEDFGSFTILVNNAGITRDNLLMRMSEDQWNEVIRVNLNSVFNLTKTSLRTFLKNREGSIINMSSVVGVNGNAGQANYAASKAGIIGFSKSTAKELGSRNIRCNVIAPGFIATEMTGKLDESVVKGWVEGIPLKRAGTPDDVADLCTFLASDMSLYITGQVVNICGGMLM
jgi:3-oxoacyl-[acyl-carrier protein] reductase